MIQNVIWTERLRAAACTLIGHVGECGLPNGHVCVKASLPYAAREVNSRRMVDLNKKSHTTFREKTTVVILVKGILKRTGKEKDDK